MMKPVIGITLDEEIAKSYSKFPWYAARKNYSQSIQKAGGLSVFIPNNIRDINLYLKLINGLVITGGDFDIDPKLYGDKKTSSKVSMKKDRTEFEFKIASQALKKKIPILGICGGQQLINVMLGGTLIQHIPDSFNTEINHEQKNPRDQGSHSVTIKKKSKLFQIVKNTTMFVNSAHHQAVDKLGKNLIASAFSDDGIIEGIETTTNNYCLGVQWHPEFLIDKSDIKIFKSLVTSAKKRIEK
ncbi:MAG: gamma-glutamyl-gamma-aminobutyrate hydrolase family protein [Alphaproteobacteria bacterium]